MTEDNQSERKSAETEKTAKVHKRASKAAVKPKAPGTPKAPGKTKAPGKAKASGKGKPAGKAKKAAKLIIDRLRDPLGDPSDGEGMVATGPEAETGSPTQISAEPMTDATGEDLANSAGQVDEEHKGPPQGDVAESAAPQESDEEPEPRPQAKLERLQKILAQAGIASRRHAEELITEGRVQVNGQVVTVLGSKADPERDHIRVDGKLLHGAERLRYFVLNKPKGYVTTVSDPEGRPTVMEFFGKLGERLYPVGRLDFQSEGLLLMTNDGDLANRLTKAVSGVEKTYLVKVSGEPGEEQLNALREGISIERGRVGEGKVRTAPARIRQVRQGDNPWYEVVLIEGRNRELRKMFEEIGHHVEKIRRVGYGPLVLDLEPGKMRELDRDEVEALRRTAEGKLKPRAPKTSHMLPREAGIPAEQRAFKNARSGKPFGKQEYGRERGGRPPQRPGFSTGRGGSFPRRDDRPGRLRADRPGEKPPERQGFSGSRGGSFAKRDDRPGRLRADRPGERPVRFNAGDRPTGQGRTDWPRGERPASAGRFGERPSGMGRKPPFHSTGERPRQHGPQGAKQREFRPRFERPENRGAGSSAGTGARFDRRPERGPRTADDRFGQKPGEGRSRKPDDRSGEPRPQNRNPRPSFVGKPSSHEERGTKPPFRGKAGAPGDRGKRSFGARPGGSAKPAFKKKATWGKGPQGRKPGRPFGGGKPNQRRG